MALLISTVQNQKISYGSPAAVKGVTQKSLRFIIKVVSVPNDILTHPIAGLYSSTATDEMYLLEAAYVSPSKWDLYFIVHWSTGDGMWRLPNLNYNSVYDAVITYDGGATSNNPLGYLNGVSKSVAKDAGPTGTLRVGTGGNFIIGDFFNNGTQLPPNFYFQEYALLSGILTAGQVSSLWNGGSPKLNAYPTTPVLYDPLLTASANASGGSTYPFTGTLVGGTNYLEDRINGTQGTITGSPQGASDLIFGTGY